MLAWVWTCSTAAISSPGDGSEPSWAQADADANINTAARMPNLRLNCGASKPESACFPHCLVCASKVGFHQDHVTELT